MSKQVLMQKYHDTPAVPLSGMKPLPNYYNAVHGVTHAGEPEAFHAKLRECCSGSLNV